MHLASAPLYGLDIETDTTTDGLDPATSPIIAVAVAGADWVEVLDGAEADILASLERLLGSLPPGVLVTWNGSRFDLPFLVDRAERCAVAMSLELTVDHLRRSRRDPLPGHVGGYRATWGAHAHVDAYQVYRSDVGASLGLPCGLKSLARFVGLAPVEVDRTRLHLLPPDELHDYVASDAVLARELLMRRWPQAVGGVDPVGSAARPVAAATQSMGS